MFLRQRLERSSDDGDSVQQRDSATIDAPCVLADIADNIIRFQVEYKK